MSKSRECVEVVLMLYPRDEGMERRVRADVNGLLVKLQRSTDYRKPRVVSVKCVTAKANAKDPCISCGKNRVWYRDGMCKQCYCGV
jgi:hypothetical protein